MFFGLVHAVLVTYGVTEAGEAGGGGGGGLSTVQDEQLVDAKRISLVLEAC